MDPVNVPAKFEVRSFTPCMTEIQSLYLPQHSQTYCMILYFTLCDVYGIQLDMEDGDAIDVFQQQTGGYFVETWLSVRH